MFAFSFLFRSLEYFLTLKRRPDIDLTVDEMIKIDASTSDQPCTSFGINKQLGQGFVDLYSQKEMIFFASECLVLPS